MSLSLLSEYIENRLSYIKNKMVSRKYAIGGTTYVERNQYNSKKLQYEDELKILKDDIKDTTNSILKVNADIKHDLVYIEKYVDTSVSTDNEKYISPFDEEKIYKYKEEKTQLDEQVYEQNEIIEGMLIKLDSEEVKKIRCITKKKELSLLILIAKLALNKINIENKYTIEDELILLDDELMYLQPYINEYVDNKLHEIGEKYSIIDHLVNDAIDNLKNASNMLLYKKEKVLVSLSCLLFNMQGIIKLKNINNSFNAYIDNLDRSNNNHSLYEIFTTWSTKDEKIINTEYIRKKDEILNKIQQVIKTLSSITGGRKHKKVRNIQR